MSLLVLSFPELEKKHYDWIQALRHTYDELYYKVVEPHFSVVFSVSGFDKIEFIHEIQEKSKGIRPIDFLIKCAVVVKDTFGVDWHTLLVPDTGYSEIVKLHDKVYSGILSKELRLDIPFIPHVGIGNSKDPLLCKKLADEINSQAISIKGKLKELDVVWYENNKVETIQKIKLQTIQGRV